MNLKSHKKDLVFSLTLFILSFLSVFWIYQTRLNFPPIRSDGIGYYSYLPAIFVHKDLSMNSLIEEKLKDEPEIPNSYAGIYVYKDSGKRIDKYPIGVAVLMAPFFFIAHFASFITGVDKEGGFGAFYQLSAGFSGMFYFLFGLYLLKRFLIKRFSEKTTYFTLFIITFGTNLFHYGTYDSIFSHVYSFFLISAFLNIVESWYSKINLKKTLLLGLISGLIILVRPTNAIFLLLFPLYEILNIKDATQRLKLYKKNYKHILVILVSGFLLLVPQMLYWKYVTGKFITFPYEPGEGFTNLLKPEIFNVLLSVRKGFFFWAPVLLLSIPGIYLSRKYIKNFWLPIIFILIIHIYTISSWWHWPYGGSFGHRAFIEALPFFAIFYASVLSFIKNRKFKIIFCFLSFILVMICVKSMLAYWIGDIPIDNTSLRLYLHTWAIK